MKSEVKSKPPKDIDVDKSLLKAETKQLTTGSIKALLTKIDKRIAAIEKKLLKVNELEKALIPLA
jgi:hypothetical protein